METKDVLSSGEALVSYIPFALHWDVSSTDDAASGIRFFYDTDSAGLFTINALTSVSISIAPDGSSHFGWPELTLRPGERVGTSSFPDVNPFDQVILTPSQQLITAATGKEEPVRQPIHGDDLRPSLTPAMREKRYRFVEQFVVEGEPFMEAGELQTPTA